ncbi:hypothetical protein FNP_2341 [Fusobacterium polymorphum ATCC 10953]|uniref:Uncharacterized protein n=1 Tax=Fusobacterium polymorphum ATCC 10953 TaxID=393480 RepID=A5TS55_FUSNP|nr:hypothetical protein FNP_2341 [Fusobacterium polymorphum ATCC 10953]
MLRFAWLILFNFYPKIWNVTHLFYRIILLIRKVEELYEKYDRLFQVKL